MVEAAGQRTPEAVDRRVACGTRNKVRIRVEVWSRRWDSNPRPTVYETVALPLSYFGPREAG
jgi:hypothetical protein